MTLLCVGLYSCTSHNDEPKAQISQSQEDVNLRASIEKFRSAYLLAEETRQALLASAYSSRLRVTTPDRDWSTIKKLEEYGDELVAPAKEFISSLGITDADVRDMLSIDQFAPLKNSDYVDVATVSMFVADVTPHAYEIGMDEFLTIFRGCAIETFGISAGFREAAQWASGKRIGRAAIRTMTRIALKALGRTVLTGLGGFVGPTIMAIDLGWCMYREYDKRRPDCTYSLPVSYLPKYPKRDKLGNLEIGF